MDEPAREQQLLEEIADLLLTLALSGFRIDWDRYRSLGVDVDEVFRRVKERERDDF